MTVRRCSFVSHYVVPREKICPIPQCNAALLLLAYFCNNNMRYPSNLPLAVWFYQNRSQSQDLEHYLISIRAEGLSP